MICYKRTVNLAIIPGMSGSLHLQKECGWGLGTSHSWTPKCPCLHGQVIFSRPLPFQHQYLQHHLHIDRVAMKELKHGDLQNSLAWPEPPIFWPHSFCIRGTEEHRGSWGYRCLHPCGHTDSSQALISPHPCLHTASQDTLIHARHTFLPLMEDLGMPTPFWATKTALPNCDWTEGITLLSPAPHCQPQCMGLRTVVKHS